MDKNRYFQIRSGKYIKTKVADIQRLYSKWLWLVMAVYKPLLTDSQKDNFVKKLDELFKSMNDQSKEFQLNSIL